MISVECKRGSNMETSELCVSKVVELSQWLAMLEEKVTLLSWEIEHLRKLVKDLGGDLGLE